MKISVSGMKVDPPGMEFLAPGMKVDPPGMKIFRPYAGLECI